MIFFISGGVSEPPDPPLLDPTMKLTKSKFSVKLEKKVYKKLIVMVLPRSNDHVNIGVFVNIEIKTFSGQA